MSLDPATPFPMTPESRQASALAGLERRVRALEAGAPTIQVQAGAPTTAPRDGTPAGDTANTRLWLRLGGVWRYVTLT